MVIARKLLLPTLILFALVLAAMSTYLGAQARTALENEENRYLLNLTQAFEQDLQAKSEVSLALAKQIAGNSAVADALDNQNRLSLIAQTLNAYNSIQPIYHISQQQFVVNPATVLLRLQQTDKYGDSLAASRLTLVNAIALGQDVTGLELDADGLGLRGVAYLEGDRTRGAIDIGITLDQASLLDMKNQYGSDWQLHLDRQTMQIAGYSMPSGMPVGPHADLALIANTNETGPVFAPEMAYQKALDGGTVISRLELAGRSYGIITMPLRDFSSRVVGVVDIVADRTDAVAALQQQIILAVAAGLAGLLLIGIFLAWIIGRMLNPVRQLTQVAQTYAEGDLTGGLPANLQKRLAGRRLDEIDLLARSFDRMAAQLRRLVGNLEDRVAERTQDLEQRTTQLRAVAEITRDVTVVTNLQAVLDQAAQLVRQRFDFYHAGVFLVDESGEHAILQAATGEAGRRMVEAGHQLRVGQVGIVGSTTGSAKPHVSQDVDQDPSYFKNPNLPDTRSEAALPMRLGQKVIGALDVQSDRPNAFSEGDIAVLQILADQLAIAVNNARLIQELNRNVNELEQAYRSMTRQTWGGFIRQQSQASGYRYTPTVRQQREESTAAPGTGGFETRSAGPATPGAPEPAEKMPDLFITSSLQPLPPTGLGPEANAALDGNQPVVQPDSTAEQTTLAVPIRLRDQAIGVINLRFEGGDIAPELVEMVNDVGSRLGLVLESARLLHEAQRLASREQQINLIATQVRSSVNLDAILQNTVRELGKALGAQRTFIQLSPADAAAPAPPADPVFSTGPVPPAGPAPSTGPVLSTDPDTAGRS